MHKITVTTENYYLENKITCATELLRRRRRRRNPAEEFLNISQAIIEITNAIIENKNHYHA